MAGDPIVDVHERLPLDTGWETLATPPGAGDHRLIGFDSETIPAAVPGTAAAALLAAGYQAAGRDLDAEDWWFRCRFPAPPEDPGAETLLRLDGLATLADVWLNGEHILSSENMFERHEIQVDSLLRPSNELVIGFRALATELAVKRRRPRWHTRLVAHQGLRFIRTTLLGRAPAFAPEPAPVGPWQPVSLEQRRLIAVEDARLRTSLDGDAGILSATLTLRPLGKFQVERASLQLDGPSGSHRAALELTVDANRVTATGELRVPSVVRWWPHTHGDPALHTVRVGLESPDVQLDVDWGRVGFRSLDAITEPGLALQVNGVPIFCRGGALLPELVTLDLSARRLRPLLARVCEAGMNMIRLSGVSVYASDDLLELCDELGVLLWQDFAFAGLDYPVEDDAFRASVEREATGFLARAGGRACLAVLCGNSEVEQQVAMLGLDPGLGRDELFGEILPRLAKAQSVDAVYVPSSPSGGELPFDPNAGVAHYFGVGAYRRPLDDARRSEVRFASECLAFANVPDEETIARIAPDGSTILPVHHPAWKAGVSRDTGAGWDFDDVRDHYLAELFRVDPVGLRSFDLERYVALSRVVTGEVMAEVFGEWRRRRSTCAGGLIWWLNDLVPGAGWGVLDSQGRPKAAYWYLKRALAPVAVWITHEGTNGLAVHVANDTGLALAATLHLALYRADGATAGAEAVDLVLPPQQVSQRSFDGVLGHFADAGYAFRFGPPGHEVAVATLQVGGAFRSQSFAFPLGRPTHVTPLSDLGLEAAATPAADGSHVLEVRTRRLAYAVSVDVPGFDPDDDFFTVAPGQKCSIRLVPRHAEAKQLQGSVRALNADTRAVVRPEPSIA